MNIPPTLLDLINEISECHLQEVFRILKIDQTEVFKSFCVKYPKPAPCRGFMLSLFGGDRAAIEALYKRVEGALFVMGCAPGVGIAFNVIDACFCYMLGNWFGLVVALLSCFPIPGFKAAGKGMEKFLTLAVKRVPVGEMASKLTRAIGKRMELLRNMVDGSPYVTIQKSVRKYIVGSGNSFADESVRQLDNVISKFGPKPDYMTMSGTATYSTARFSELTLSVKKK